MKNLIFLSILALGCANSGAITPTQKFTQIELTKTIHSKVKSFHGLDSTASPDGWLQQNVTTINVTKQRDPSGPRMKVVVNPNTPEEATTIIIGNMMSATGPGRETIIPPTQLDDESASLIEEFNVEEEDGEVRSSRANQVIANSCGNEESETTYDHRGRPTRVVIQGHSTVKRSAVDPGREDITTVDISYMDVLIDQEPSIEIVGEYSHELRERFAGITRKLLEETITVDLDSIVVTKEADAITF